jgi:hypothetical protein
MNPDLAALAGTWRLLSADATFADTGNVLSSLDRNRRAG